MSNNSGTPQTTIARQHYSEEFDDSVRGKIALLEALEHDRFRSHVCVLIDPPAQEDQPAATILSWHDAVRLEPGNWAIRVHHTLATTDPEDTAKIHYEDDTTTLSTGLNFFDALAAIARYDMAAKDLNGSAEDAQDIPQGLPPLFQDVANDEGIPFDLKKELPMPVYNGIVLVDGRYNPEVLGKRPQNAIAPAQNLPVPAQAQQIVPADFRDGNFSLAIRDEADLAKKKYKPALENLAGSFNDAHTIIKRGVNFDFDTSRHTNAWIKGSLGTSVTGIATAIGCIALGGPFFLGLAGGVMGFGALFIAGGVSDNQYFNPMRSYKKFMESSDRAIVAIPESMLRQEAQAFQTRVGLTYHTLWVHDRLEAANLKPKSGGARRRLKEAWDALDAFCDSKRFSPLDRDTIHQMIEEHVGDTQFQHRLVDRLREEQSEMADRIERAGKKKRGSADEALPAPQGNGREVPKLL